MNLYDRITKPVVLRSELDAMAKKLMDATVAKQKAEAQRDDAIKAHQKVYEDLSMLRREVAMLTKYVDNTPDKKGKQEARYDLDHFHVVRRKDGEIVANLLANRPINTPSLISVPADRTKNVGEYITLTKE